MLQNVMPNMACNKKCVQGLMYVLEKFMMKMVCLLAMF